jgi:hypothetical protein
MTLFEALTRRLSGRRRHSFAGTDVALVLGGVGLGAGLLFFFEAGAGPARRARVRAQLFRARRRLEGLFVHRRLGLGAPALFRVPRTEPIADVILTERVRAKLIPFVSSPRALQVQVHDGIATLGGPVLHEEAAKLLTAARSVLGVKEVLDRLERHERSEMPALRT